MKPTLYFDKTFSHFFWGFLAMLFVSLSVMVFAGQERYKENENSHVQAGFEQREL